MALGRASSTASKYSSTSLLPSLRVAHETVRELDILLTTGKSMKPKSQRFASPHPKSTEKPSSEGNLFRVSAYGIGQSINLAQLSSAFDYVAMGYRCLRLPPEATNEILFFATPFDAHDPIKDRDVLVFNGPTRLDVEDIRLHALPSRSDTAESQKAYEQAVQNLIMEKIAFSDALASSVKLALLETSFDAVAVQMQPWIDKMQTGLGLFFPMSSVIRKTGELFTLRHLLNISTTISETPDFYWDRSDVEKLFQSLKNALSVRSRTRTLNSKLDMCCELTEILTNHLQARHSSRLEWMIIVLILIEVIFEVQRSRSGKRSQNDQKRQDR